MITALLAVAALAAPPVPSDPLVPPLDEVDHPRYEDANGQPIDWREIRSLAAKSDARRRVRGRRLGRNVLRFSFAGLTALEVWGTVRLANRGNFFAVPLAVQAAATGGAAILLWTQMPGDRREDRAILLNGAESVLVKPR
ncbi:MAG: hypothetical protein AAGA48_04700 [Myxococcota bacterium]